MQPRSRNSRHKDRETIEKDMLVNRTGSFHRYEVVESVVKVDPNCPSSLSGKLAFISTDDVAHYERLEREHQRAIKEEKTEKKRSDTYARESERWASYERNRLIEEDRLKRAQNDPLITKRNCGSNPYDIVTMEYHHSPEGDMLRYHDELVDYRHGIRSAFLSQKNHLGFNCITGEQIVDINIPSRPSPPSPPNQSHSSFCISRKFSYEFPR